MAKSPQGFIVVLPGEIIEIAQDDDISWLTLFYALPKELAEKYPDALKIPRSPYGVLYEGSYGAVAKSEMLKSEKSFLQHYSMIYKTEKRHDRNHAVSRKQLLNCFIGPLRRAAFIMRDWGHPCSAW